MRVLFLPSHNKCDKSSVIFQGKSETFLKLYQKSLTDIPLKEAVIKSIGDENNLIGEGRLKKVYDFKGLKDYVIRIFKNNFNDKDLEQTFIKPKKHSESLDEVVLAISGKIDIAKKKTGLCLGVKDFSKRIDADKFPPMQNVYVTREETLNSLKLYEQLQGFPLKAYKEAYRDVRRFCKKTGFQLDIISPNNILIDTEKKTIKLIDPLGPEVNDAVQGKNINFSGFHGSDSLYPVLCDFLLHTEHIANLNPEELLRWDKAVSNIISKCINAGNSIGYKRNINELNSLYKKISKFWTTDKIHGRYNCFIDRYSDTINFEKSVNTALNYQNSEAERIKAIGHLNVQNFKDIKPLFEKILEAPHQVKVELPEILNAALDKIKEYGKDAKTVFPAIEKLFDKEIFYPTKKRMYNLFIELQPFNKRFLKEISKSADNLFERTLYKDEFNKLFRTTNGVRKENKLIIKDIHKRFLEGEKISQQVVDKLWISRTCVNTGKEQLISLKNMEKAYDYINSQKNNIPNSKDLIEIHKKILADTPGQEDIVGILRTPETDHILKRIFNIKKSLKNKVNPYVESKNVVTALKKLDSYIVSNYLNSDPFLMAANIFSGLIKIHPFLNGNGRATRLFTEQFLLSKGYNLNMWPEEFLYRKLYSNKELANFLRQNSSPVLKHDK